MRGTLFQKTKVDRWSLGLEHDLDRNVHPEKPTAPLFFHFLDSPPNFVFCVPFFVCVSLQAFSLNHFLKQLCLYIS